MTNQFVCFAPSRLEAAALGRGLPAGIVRHTGMGRAAGRRVDNSALSGLLDSADVMAVAGIAGGLSPRVRTGDVVVATEVRGPDGIVACPSAPMLAAEFRRSGLTVHLGPVDSDHHVVTGRERAIRADLGALCVDMESAALVRRADEQRPHAVVRVVADVAGARLLQPATVGRLRTALQVLPRLGPGLLAWADATGPRQVRYAAPRSFCAGVIRAIDIVTRALDTRGAPVYVRKQIVHNRHVVQDLESRGAVFVDELDAVPNGALVVFSAHGVSPAVHAEAASRGLQVIDATCPLVSKVHSEVRRFVDRQHTVLFIGHAGHEETVGTMGERPGGTLLVETAADAATVEVPDPDRVSYLVQTTLAMDEVSEVVDVLRQRFPRLRAPASDDICYATTNRQQAVQTVARESELVLVVGSTNSSNSNRLVETARRTGVPAYLIDDAEDIRLDWLAGVQTVGITAGASAPASLVDDVVAALRGLGPVEITERAVTSEHVFFALPKEVR